MYALIDSNNFFVSCERLFRPDLAHTPVVVLSSNDGCAISRSSEAKALGIPMGAPIFKYRDLFRRHGVTAFSANFELYGDISERISTLLTSITPHIELYSIDEAFLDLSKLDIADYETWGRDIRTTILRNIGIPVSVGIAPTKTLCKLANHWAKTHRTTQGVFLLEPRDMSQEINNPPNSYLMTLHSAPVEDIWGVGYRLAPKLRAEGIFTALDLARLRPQRAQQLMGIHGRHMVYELRGTRCLPLKSATKPQHMVCRGRQFGEDTSDFHVIEAAITTLASRAATELRREGQLASSAAVILRTNRLKPGYTSTFDNVRFYTPTADTGTICSQLIRTLTRTYNPHLSYHKADVLLYGLAPVHHIQTDVFGSVDLASHARSQARMRALDAVNAKHGPHALRPAAELLSDAWKPRSAMHSPRYTSAWPDLPEVHTMQN